MLVRLYYNTSSLSLSLSHTHTHKRGGYLNILSIMSLDIHEVVNMSMGHSKVLPSSTVLRQQKPRKLFGRANIIHGSLFIMIFTEYRPPKEQHRFSIHPRDTYLIYCRYNNTHTHTHIHTHIYIHARIHTHAHTDFLHPPLSQQTFQDNKTLRIVINSLKSALMYFLQNSLRVRFR